MNERFVGRVDEIQGGERRLVSLGDREVAVFEANGQIRAFENHCPHMGGPVGEGMIIGRVEAVLDDSKRLVCEQFSQDDLQIVCPWHGWAYDVESGAFAGNPSIRLRAYDVDVRDGDVYVRG